jgi:hypothetical protein
MIIFRLLPLCRTGYLQNVWCRFAHFLSQAFLQPGKTGASAMCNNLGHGSCLNDSAKRISPQALRRGRSESFPSRAYAVSCSEVRSLFLHPAPPTVKPEMEGYSIGMS